MTRSLLSLALCLALFTQGADAKDVGVQAIPGGWTMTIDGAPAVVRGAAASLYTPDSLHTLAQTGATALRTYGRDQVDALAAARTAGLGVVFGLDVEPGRSVDYGDPAQRQREIARLLPFVFAHRDDPALLAWGIGNEIEADTADPRSSWRMADALAAAIAAIDPHHPTVLTIADTSRERLALLAESTPHVAIIALNAYAGAASNGADRLTAAGVHKPLMIAELGPLGQWQAGRKPWGAPVELTSTEKARFYADILPKLAHDPRIVGVFAFLWGAKTEQTATWHGLLLPDGTRLGAVDAMTTAWTGSSPAHPVPIIKGIGINADGIAHGAPLSAGIDARGDGPLTYRWSLTTEAGNTVPLTVPPDKAMATTAPTTPGAYRLFIEVRDTHGGAATANLPFLVQ